MPQSAATADLDEAGKRLTQAAAHIAAGELDEAVSICSAAIGELPRDGSAQALLLKAYERLILARERQGLDARALRVFRQYVRDCAPQCDPDYDDEYVDGLRATHSSPVPLRRRERFYSLVQLLGEALPLTGLIAECGSYRGLSSYLLCRRIKRAETAFDGKGYRIFDSFEGLSAPEAEDAYSAFDPGAGTLAEMMKPGAFAAPLELVKASLADFPRVEYFPGWIPAAFPDEPDARYRFVHLDVDLYQPTRDSLEYFYPRLVPGGRIVCDDFNWPGGRKAIEEFCARVSARLSITPQNQASIEAAAGA